MSDVFRDGYVHVQRRRCDTCIFRPGNLMHLEPGRVEEMVETADRADGCIPCHKTTHQGGGEAVCRGYFDRRSSMPIRLAVAHDRVRFV